MCPSSPKAAPAPTIPETPPAPPAPEPTAESVQTEGPGRTAASNDKQQVLAKAGGTKDLRIDLNIAQPGGKGLNIARG